MCPVEITIWVYHLRFDPEADIHPKAVDIGDQRIEPVREFLLVHCPIAQTGMVVIAGAEPAIIHDKKFDAQLGRLFGERTLAGFIDRELSCFP